MIAWFALEVRFRAEIPGNIYFVQVFLHHACAVGVAPSPLHQRKSDSLFPSRQAYTHHLRSHGGGGGVRWTNARECEKYTKHTHVNDKNSES